MKEPKIGDWISLPVPFIGGHIKRLYETEGDEIRVMVVLLTDGNVAALPYTEDDITPTRLN